ncbi:hypothetical protein KEH51_01205 [[Brevibacterium] frigoritolerans]|uniref:Peptidase S11 D-alanyl-D-alanine carboxypeptidase A N-terminal domain-containing protein n=1 Tax=Peribacillus frigoritolerans TaxID=450367 RepID=A0A941FJE1_9BACI|nr:hypothetical protein [Peribacillus frigoritolerans]
MIAVTLKAPSDKVAYSDTKLLFNYGFENFKSGKLIKKQTLFSGLL